jgi:SAM-dependent methyltransferase
MNKKDSNVRCRICGNNSENSPFAAREMMFGLRESFDYFQCDICGCIQILRIPDDLSKYYPDQYYAYKSPGWSKILIKGPWLCDPFSWKKAILRALSFLPGVHVMPEWMSRAGLPLSASILEIGSGSGTRLIAMREAGYRDLTGIDPYISGDGSYSDGIRVLKREVRQIDRRYDFVMMHHSFEHMPDPFTALREVNGVLAPKGTVLIRIPVASCYAWKKYGVNWYAFDAPRHLYLHSPASLKCVAETVGFEIFDMFYDSDSYQFIGSEQYARDIPAQDQRSYFVNRSRSIFKSADIRAFENEAKRLNRCGEGDSAAFYLRRKSR